MMQTIVTNTQTLPMVTIRVVLPIILLAGSFCNSWVASSSAISVGPNDGIGRDDPESSRSELAGHADDSTTRSTSSLVQSQLSYGTGPPPHTPAGADVGINSAHRTQGHRHLLAYDLASDRAALLAQKSAITNAGTLLSNWTVAGNPCSFDYVICNNASTRVANLTLAGLNISGTIARELASLTELTYLLFNTNSLSGTIPPELGSLSSLQRMYLHANTLSGAIPPELGSLSSLQRLYLYGNQLSGTIPFSLASLSSLQRLYLYTNPLSGTIPPELSSLSSLQRLYLYQNKLSGTILPQLASLTSLQRLDLDNNTLSGTIPRELASLSSLSYLILNSNQLNGTIPPELGALSSLQRLYLYQNKLSGTILPQLGSLSSLQILYLYENLLVGTIPPELGYLYYLQRLDLDTNQLSGTIPPQLASLYNLNYLDLDTNLLSGTIPPQLASLYNLTYLYLHQTPLTGTIPPELGSLSSLLRLYLFTTQLSGTIPPELGSLSSLQRLYLYQNKLSGTILPQLASLSSLNYLYLFANALSGTIPSLLGGLRGLIDLDLGNNALSGSIPRELGSLYNLTSLNLNTNQLNDTIPAVLASLNSLVYLNLASDKLTGTIPRELASLSSLQSLYLFVNELSGTIPPELGSLSSLKTLALHQDKLSGTIPSTLGSLASLQFLNLRDNRLLGTIPPQLGSLANLTTLIVTNNSWICGPDPAGKTLNRTGTWALTCPACFNTSPSLLEPDYNCTQGSPVCTNLATCAVCWDSTAGLGTDDGCDLNRPLCVNGTCGACWDSVAGGGVDDGCDVTRPLCFKGICFADDYLKTPNLTYSERGFGGIPAAPAIAVGPAHLVTIVKSSFARSLYRVYVKEPWLQVKQSFLTQFHRSNTICRVGPFVGAPYTLYDHLADRWLIMELARNSTSGGYFLCLLVSLSNIPYGLLYRGYAIALPGDPGEVAMAVMPDAYYLGTTEIPPAIYALDRVQYVTGGVARPMIRVSPSALTGPVPQGLAPGALSGSPRVGSSCGLFVRAVDDELLTQGMPDGSADFIEVWELCPSFDNAGGSTLHRLANVNISEYTATICGGTSDVPCFSQPGSAVLVTADRGGMPAQVSYRSYSDHESLVATFTVNGGNDKGAVMWVELRRAVSASGALGPWERLQDGVTPSDGKNRWHGSAAMDRLGDIALGYSVVDASSGVYPSMYYSGRSVVSPIGVMTSPEALLTGGAAASATSAFGGRSAMAVDAMDGCRFYLLGPWETRASRSATYIGATSFGRCAGSAQCSLDTDCNDGQFCTADKCRDGKCVSEADPLLCRYGEICDEVADFCRTP